MAASDEVAGLPGGQILAALAAQVRGDPAAIRHIASKWSDAAAGCGDHTGVVHAAVTEAGQYWKGSSAAAFAALMEHFSRAGRGAQKALRAAAATLRRAAASLEEANRAIEGICENLIGEVSRLQAASPWSPAADLGAEIGALVAEATDAARRTAAEAQHALDQAHAALSGDLSELNRAFSTLPKPGGDGFAVGWRQPARPHHAAAGAPGSGGGQAALTAYQAGGGAAGSPGVSGGTVVAAVAGAGAAGAGAAVAAGPAAPAQVNGWIQQAIRILEAHGIPAAKLNPQDIWIIIDHESSGNPLAVNNWDSNAAAGDPSKGLMQCISTTFSAYALPGHGDVFNPVDNIIAGVRYALARYGSLGDVPGVAAVHAGQPYVGY